MEEILIRPATLADLPILLHFEQGVITAERPFNPTIRPGNINYYNIPGMIEADHIQLLVAEERGELIASGYARIEPADRHYLTYSQRGYLGFMYTDPAHRGKGVNQRIVAALGEWVASRGIVELVLEVYSDNEPAIRAYEKAGFKRHLITMRKPVDGVTTPRSS